MIGDLDGEPNRNWNEERKLKESAVISENRPRLRLKKMFKVKKFCQKKQMTHKSNNFKFSAEKIFCIKKMNKKSKTVEVETKILLNFTEKNVSANALTLDDIKKRMTEKLYHESALDLKDFKLYHQIHLHQKHNFYVSPVASDEEPSESSYTDGEMKIKRYKRHREVQTEKSKEPDSQHKINSHFNRNLNLQNLRIISPYNKHVSCNCKKSQCLKNYCVCKINKEVCDESCQCVSCKNLTFFSSLNN